MTKEELTKKYIECKLAIISMIAQFYEYESVSSLKNKVIPRRYVFHNFETEAMEAWQLLGFENDLVERDALSRLYEETLKTQIINQKNEDVYYEILKMQYLLINFVMKNYRYDIEEDLYLANSYINVDKDIIYTDEYGRRLVKSYFHLCEGAGEKSWIALDLKDNYINEMKMNKIKNNYQRRLMKQFEKNSKYNK